MHHVLPRFEGCSWVRAALMDLESGAGAVVQVRDAGVESQETLCPLSSPEAALLALVSSCRAMGLLDQVVAAGGGDNLNVLHGVEHRKFPKSGAITPELVGVDDLWYVVLTEQSTEEQSGSLGIAVFLKEDVQHGSVFVDRPPQPVFDPAHVHAP